MKILEKLGIIKPKEIKQEEIKQEETLEETLEEWRNKIIIIREKETSPYTDYIKKCCIDCDKFSYNKCFAIDGGIYDVKLLQCIKVRSYLENKENIIECVQIIKEQFDI